MTATVRGTVGGMARRANPAFAILVVVLPVVALVYAVEFGRTVTHIYVHVMAGLLWTGTDLFMALVLGPVLGGLGLEERASVFERFTPKMAFLVPTLALVTIAGGITLALRLGAFPAADPWLALFTAASLLPALLVLGWQFDALGDWRWLSAFGVSALASAVWLAVSLPAFEMTRHTIAAALGVVVVLTVVGFGLILPGEVRIYRQLVSEDPDTEVIGRIGMRNARLAAVQGTFQLVIIALMVGIRWGY